MTEHPCSWLRRIDATVRSWKVYYLAMTANMISSAAGIIMFLASLPNTIMIGDFAGTGIGLFLAFAGGVGLWKDGTESLERGLRDLATLSRRMVLRFTRVADNLSQKADKITKSLGR